MTILALEFSSERRSVAVASNGKLLAEASEGGGYRATNAFALIEKALTDAKVQREQIEAIAVGLGPGSYTGIRAAIAIAQGWQLACGVKLIGISSVETLAAQAQQAGLHGQVHVIIDAQREEYYLAIWEVSEMDLKEISPLKIVAKQEVEVLKDANKICVGPSAYDNILHPSAAVLAKLVMIQSNFNSANELEPIYLRETNFAKAPTPRFLYS